MSSDLDRAQWMAQNGKMDQAYVEAEKHLRLNPDNVDWLILMVYIMLNSDKQTIAYHLSQRAVALAPRNASAYLNAGMAAGDLWRVSEAERLYRKGLRFAVEDESRVKLMVNLAAMLIDNGRFVEAEPIAAKALELAPDSRSARANIGFAQLAQRNFAEGWVNYRSTIGDDWRPRTQYGDEPEWDGVGEGTIVIYAEQGLGDVISFGSMIPDMVEWCRTHNSRLIFDVNARLEAMFKRTFPEVTIYGTREKSAVSWAAEDTRIDYSLPIGQLGEYFRTSEGAFPDGKYLVPDPDRALMWKSLFASKGKPAIGIAWRGGIPRTGSRFRQWDLDQLLPLLSSVDAHWVSLQYKPAAAEIKDFRARHPEIDLVEYPHGTLTQDYDDTAALVAALDQVVIIHTAVGHLAGAMGVPCLTFIPTNSQWRYGTTETDFPWARSVELVRQTRRGYWEDVIKQTGDRLHAYFGRVPAAAAKASPGGKLRGDRAKVRTIGNRHH